METTVAAAQAAGRAAEDAAAAAESATAAITTLLSERPAASGKQTAVLSFGCAVLFTLSSAFIIWGAGAFSNPQAVPDDLGAVGVGFETVKPSSPSSLPFQDLPIVYISAYFSEDDRAEYTIWVPGSFREKKFVVLYEDAAVMRNPSSTTGRIVTKGPTPCTHTFDVGRARISVPHMCQLIFGSVPSNSSASGFCEPRPLDARDYIPIQITGETDAYMRSDWAHQLISTPSLFIDLHLSAINE